MKNILILIIALCTTPKISLADSNQSISFGLSKYQSKNESEVFEFDPIDDKLTKQIKYLYSVNETFSIGGQWLSTTASEYGGSSGSRDLDWDLNSLTVFGEAKANLIGAFFGYAYIGQSYTDSEYDGYNVVEGDILLPARKSSSGFSTSFGVGLKYQFKSIELALEQQWLETEHVDLILTSFVVGIRF